MPPDWESRDRPTRKGTFTTVNSCCTVFNRKWFCNNFMCVFSGVAKGRDLDEALQERDAASNVLLSK